MTHNHLSIADLPIVGMAKPADDALTLARPSLCDRSN